MKAGLFKKITAGIAVCGAVICLNGSTALAARGCEEKSYTHIYLLDPLGTVPGLQCIGKCPIRGTCWPGKPTRIGLTSSSGHCKCYASGQAQEMKDAITALYEISQQAADLINDGDPLSGEPVLTNP